LTVSIVLPWPPSLNNLYMNVHGRGRVKAPSYRAWATEVIWLIKARNIAQFQVPVSITIDLAPPTKRAFDLDGKAKAAIDCLVAAGVLQDDNNKWVKCLTIREVISPDACTVTIEEYGE
jgi:crossover junction endodeoxyribonuclease RusA